MRGFRKVRTIALIFMLIVFIWQAEFAYPYDISHLRVPMDRERLEDFFVPNFEKSLELRRAIRHDIGNIRNVIHVILYSEDSHSEGFNRTKEDLLLCLKKLFDILESPDNPDWESGFNKSFNEFMDTFDDDTLNILYKELDKERVSDLNDFISAMKLFYKSFVGDDPVKSVDLENLFKIVGAREADFAFIAFDFKGQKKARHVIVKEGEIYRAFVNLVRNAAEAIIRKKNEIYYSEGPDFTGYINVKVSFNAGYSVIKISDNGPGMPNEALEAFASRTVYSSKGDEGGRGLRATRSLIERNNGTLDVRSNLGKGTTFIIRLPSADSARPLIKNKAASVAL